MFVRVSEAKVNSLELKLTHETLESCEEVSIMSRLSLFAGNLLTASGAVLRAV